jgi:hypothetical protein
VIVPAPGADPAHTDCNPNSEDCSRQGRTFALFNLGCKPPSRICIEEAPHQLDTQGDALLSLSNCAGLLILCRCRKRGNSSARVCQNVRSWHKADIAGYAAHVRFPGQSRHSPCALFAQLVPRPHRQVDTQERTFLPQQAPVRFVQSIRMPILGQRLQERRRR